MAGPTPLLPNLPDSTKAFNRKYNKLAPMLGSMPQPIVNSLMDFDRQRVNRGASVLSSKQSAAVLATAIRQQAFTPPPERAGFTANPIKLVGNVLSNARSDLGQIVGSIPRLPRALYEEAKALPTAPAAISEALSAGDPSAILAQLSQAPGVRLLPGAFTIGNFARGEGEKAITNPLMTALDILPFAKATAPGRAATSAIKSTAPMQALSGQVSALKGAMYRTTPGQFIDQAFRERGTATLESRATARLRRAHEQSPHEAIRQTYKHIPEAEAVTLTAAMEQGVYTHKVTGPQALAALPDDRQAFIRDYLEVGDSLRREKLQEGLGGERDGEFYDLITLRRINAKNKKRDDLYAEIPEVTRRLEKNAGDPRVDELVTALQLGDIPAARKATLALQRRTVRTRDMEFAISKVKSMDIARKKADYTVKSNAPDRFNALAQAKGQEALLGRYTDHPDFDNISQLVSEGLYPLLPDIHLPNGKTRTATQEAANLTREFGQSWQELKAAGANPVYIHRVAPNMAKTIDYPRVFEAIRKPSSVRRRTADITPHVKDARVALSHEGLELLAMKASEEFATQMMAFGRRTWTEHNGQPGLMVEYLERARQHATSNPTIDVRARAKMLMDKEYVAYNPNSLITWGGGKLANFGDDLYIPKAMAENIKRMHDPKTNKLTTMMDPVMKVFRTSVLALSPRWHFNNVFGGGMASIVEDPMILTKLARNKKYMEDGTITPDIADEIGLGTGMGTVARETLDWNKAAPALHLYGIGKTLGRLYDQSATARAKASGLVEKSYSLNSAADDMYRAAAYLRGRDKALTKGMTKEAAERAGIELTRKIFQRWDEMTPIERSVMRYIFPFYGFVSHQMRYVLKYPFDHPTRAAIMGSFTRNEIEDLGTGLPERFLSLFPMGKQDAKGNQRMFNVGGMNPFRDVANMMTLSGALGSTNPLIGTIMQQAGFDPVSGGPELFPNLQFDPESGRLSAQQPGFISTALGAIAPQAQLLLAMAGKSNEYKELLKSNPEAAGRLLMSQAGLPILTKNVNVPQEYFKGDLARQEGMKDAKSQALKGNASVLAKYPGLAPLIQQVRDLQGAGKLDQYTPESAPQQSKTSTFAKAVTGSANR